MLTTILTVLVSTAIFTGFILLSNRAEKQIDEEQAKRKAQQKQ